MSDRIHAERVAHLEIILGAAVLHASRLTSEGSHGQAIILCDVVAGYAAPLLGEADGELDVVYSDALDVRADAVANREDEQERVLGEIFGPAITRAVRRV